MSSRHQQRLVRHRQLELEAHAFRMRHHPTLSEQRLWLELRGSRLGTAFRRQLVIGRFIVDLAAPSARLVIEVDGGVHFARTHLDAHRDDLLRRAGWRVLHIPAALVTANVPAATALIRAALPR